MAKQKNSQGREPKTKKSKAKKTASKQQNTSKKKNLFKCSGCGKTYEKASWYEKHIRKCRKKNNTVKAGTEGSGRNPDGSFKKGNNIGEGNPHWSKLKRYREDYLRLFREAFTPDMMTKVTLVMIYKAVQEKDITSAKTLLEYAMGKPVARIEDELEGGPERKAMQIAEALKILKMDSSDNDK